MVNQVIERELKRYPAGSALLSTTGRAGDCDQQGLYLAMSCSPALERLNMDSTDGYSFPAGRVFAQLNVDTNRQTKSAQLFGCPVNG